MHINQDQVDANVAEMNRTQWSQWTKVGWSTYGQGSDPKQDGLAAAALCKQLNLAGWKANGEAWAEQQYAWKTSAFVEGWVAGGAPCPLGWSVLSSDTANFARAFDYISALALLAQISTARCTARPTRPTPLARAWGCCRRPRCR